VKPALNLSTFSKSQLIEKVEELQEELKGTKAQVKELRIEVCFFDYFVAPVARARARACAWFRLSAERHCAGGDGDGNQAAVPENCF
jgi:hypothetical protein